MKGILTGSRVYGKPTAESDLDLVLLCSSFELVAFADAAGVELSGSPIEDAPYGLRANDANLKFGKLNIIAITDPAEFEGWVKGTQQCLDLIAQKYLSDDGSDPLGDPHRVSRDEAKAIMLKAVDDAMDAALIQPDYQI